MTGDVHTVLLAIHIPAGVIGLAAGPAALMTARHRRPRRAAAATYQVAVLVVTATACALVLLDPRRLWWLAPIALATEGLAGSGWLQSRRSRGQQTPKVVRLLGGSYVSLVTATAVVSIGGPLAWAAPSLLGAAIVEVAAARATRSDGKDRNGARRFAARV